MLKNRTWLPEFLIFFTIFAIYYYTAYPSIGSGDSSEVTVGAYTLGILHPPGFPLMVLLGKLFSFLPVGSIAFRINLVSAVFATLSAWLLAKIIAEWTQDKKAAYLASGLFAFCPIIWGYATVAEVFSLNNFFIVLFFYLYLRFEKNKNWNLVPWIALVSGLALTNHQIFLFYFLPAVACFVFHHYKDQEFYPFFSKGILFFFCGLLPYLYLPLVASLHPWITWGHTDTWRGFWIHLLRSDYGTLQLVGYKNPSPLEFFDRFLFFLKNLLSATLWIGFPVFLLGMRKSLAFTKTFAIALLLCFLFYSGIFLLLSNTDLKNLSGVLALQRFWQQAYIPVFIWMGIGFSHLFKQRFSTHIATAMVIIQILLNWKTNNQHDNYTFRDYIRALMDSAEKNAIILISSDLESSAPRYFQAAENDRTDLKILPVNLLSYWWAQPWLNRYFPEITLTGNYLLIGKTQGMQIVPNTPEFVFYQNPYSLTDFIGANIKKFPIYVSVNIPDKLELIKSYDLVPFGFLERVVPKNTPLPIIQWQIESKKLLDRANITFLETYPELSFERTLLNTEQAYLDLWSENEKKIHAVKNR